MALGVGIQTRFGREHRGKKKDNVTEKACDLRRYKVRWTYVHPAIVIAWDS